MSGPFSKVLNEILKPPGWIPRVMCLSKIRTNTKEDACRVQPALNIRLMCKKITEGHIHRSVYMLVSV